MKNKIKNNQIINIEAILKKMPLFYNKIRALTASLYKKLIACVYF